MNTFITDLQDYLASNGIGTIGTDSFISGFSDAGSVNQFALMETGSVESDKDVAKLQPTVQVLLKNQSYDAGRAIMWQIFNLLHQKHEYMMGNTSVMQSMAIQEPGHIGQNPDGLEVFSMNFVFTNRNL